MSERLPFRNQLGKPLVIPAILGAALALALTNAWYGCIMMNPSMPDSASPRLPQLLSFSFIDLVIAAGCAHAGMLTTGRLVSLLSPGSVLSRAIPLLYPFVLAAMTALIANAVLLLFMHPG